MLLVGNFFKCPASDPILGQQVEVLLLEGNLLRNPSCPYDDRSSMKIIVT